MPIVLAVSSGPLLRAHLAVRRAIGVATTSFPFTPAQSAEAAPRKVAGPAAPSTRERPPRLRHSFGWTLVGHVVYAGCQWGILVVLAQLARPEDVGAFALAYAVTAPLFLLAGLSLRSSQATDAARGFRFADYFGVRIAGMAVALAITAVVVAVSHFDATTRLVVFVVGVSKAVEGLSDVHYGVLQQNERMRPIAISLVWRGVLALASVAAVLFAGGGVVAAAAVLAIDWAVVLVAYDIPAARTVLRASGEARRPRLSRRPAMRIVATCLPLGAVIMLVSLQISVPRYFIEHRMGAAELGVFAALASLLTVANVVVSAMGQTATPRLATYFHEGRVDAFRRLLSVLVAAGVALGAGGIALSLVAGEPLLRLVFGPTYAARAGVLHVLMATGLLLYVGSLLGFALTAARLFTVQLPIFAVTTLACAGGCLWLVPRHGLSGAAWGWALSALMNVVSIAFVLGVALRNRARRGSQ